MKFKAFALAALVLVVAAALVACAPAAPKPTAAPATAIPATAVPATAVPATAVPATAAPATAAPATAATEAAAPVALELTVDELAAYDGKDGRRAYVAISGVIYDVTDVAAWKNGIHNGNVAGKDLTAAIKNSPHGESVLKNLPIVGKLK